MNQKSLEAPFGGTIGIPQVDVGQFVDPGTVYATLQDLDSMRVDFSIPEQDIRLIAIDMPVTVSTEVGNTELTGHISAIEPKIDPNSRLVTVRAEVDDPGHRINPGQFLRVRVSLPEEPNVIALPQTVLSSTLYGDSVFVVRTEGEGDAAKKTVEQVFVNAGRRSLGLVEIAEGLAAGDEVVTAGQNRLTGGATVVVDNTVNPATAAPRARRPRRTRGRARCFSEIFIRRPVLSTVLAAFILLLGFQGIVNLPVRAVPRGRGDGGDDHHHLPRRPARPDPGLHHRADRRRGRDDRERRLRHLAVDALGERGQRAHEARLQPRRGADRGALQGAERARPAPRGGRGPDHRQGHRLRSSR